MTINIKQVQSLLQCLGHSPGLIDGQWGPLSQAAMDAACAAAGVASGTADHHSDAAPEDSGILPGALKYLCADGYFRIPKGANVQLTKNFNSREFDCQGVGCCDTTVIYKNSLLMWQEIRDDIGEPLPVGDAGGSGYRCPVHNADPRVGGAAGSLHLTGAAADLHYRDPARLEVIALRHCTDGEVGRYSWGCHVGRWERGYVNRFVGNS